MTSEFKHNLFSDIPRQLPDEVFQTILQHKTIKIERILSKGQKSEDGFWYDQDQSEWILVLKGSALLELEDQIIELEEGDHLNIEAHQKHRVKWTTPEEETIWLAIFY
ncbi:MAG: cupin domain-containing protein [Spirulina sp.]